MPTATAQREKSKESVATLASWLKDAHAMEEAQIKMLEQVIKHFDEDKMIKDRLKDHLQETKRHKKDVESCLKSINEKPAVTKNLMGKFMGIGQPMPAALAEDGKVKDMIMLNSGEHFELASYEALVEAASAIGETKIADTAKRIAKEEARMADWGSKNLPKIVKQQLRSI